MSAIEPLRFRIDVGARANINARISHLAESETASLKNAHAAAGAAAGRQRAAKELLSVEIPGKAVVGGTDAPTRLLRQLYYYQTFGPSGIEDQDREKTASFVARTLETAH